MYLLAVFPRKSNVCSPFFFFFFSCHGVTINLLFWPKSNFHNYPLGSKSQFQCSFSCNIKFSSQNDNIFLAIISVLILLINSLISSFYDNYLF